jgi:hypothetical protein
VESIRFGPPHAERHGVLHAATAQRRQPTGALLCAPFGQESVRTHRLFRVIADRLARAGVPTLRFDPFGTGDSAGQDEEVTLHGWIDDVRLADSVLRERAGAASTAWIGLRLGATAAALASATPGPAPHLLMLWEPIIDGEAWLRELQVAHERALERAFPRPRPRCTNFPAAAPEPVEALGFALSAEFRSEVRRVVPSSFDAARADRLVVLADPRSQAGLLAARPWRSVGAATSRPVAGTDWNTDEAMNAAIVPSDLLAAVLSEMDAR